MMTILTERNEIAKGEPLTAYAQEQIARLTGDIHKQVHGEGVCFGVCDKIAIRAYRVLVLEGKVIA